MICCSEVAEDCERVECVDKVESVLLVRFCPESVVANTLTVEYRSIALVVFVITEEFCQLDDGSVETSPGGKVVLSSTMAEVAPTTQTIILDLMKKLLHPIESKST